MNNKDVQEAAQLLARYNLGICIPHMHDEATGQIIPLPCGMMACERDLKISFEHAEDTAEESMPVAWRWNGTSIEVCSSCCSSGPE